MTSLQTGIFISFSIICIITFIAGCYYISDWKNEMGWFAMYKVENKHGDIARHSMQAKITMVAWIIFFILFLIFLFCVLYMIFKYIF